MDLALLLRHSRRPRAPLGLGRARGGDSSLRKAPQRAAANEHDSYHRARYLRLEARRGPNKAILAVVTSMLTAAYHMLKYSVDYGDLGPLHFERDKHAQVTRLLHRLKGLGVDVTVTPAV